MDRVQHGREEHEAELDRLGHAGQERGERKAEQHAAHRLAPIGRGGVVHGEAGGGQAEHHDREEPAHETARGRIAGEEARQVAGLAVIVADDEIGDVVEDVVQTRHQQQPVEQAEGEQAEPARGDDAAAQRVDTRVDPRIARPQQRADRQAGEPGKDRDEATPAEEGEIFWQFHGGEAVVEQAADQACDDADRHLQLVDRRALPRRRQRRGDGIRGARRHCARGRHEKYLRGVADGQIADDARHHRGAVAIAREAGGDADREEQAEVREDRIPGRADEGDVQ